MNASLLAIVGPTAGGKSALAHWAAQHFKGEIIAADSRTIYKGMDIGSAKPTPQQRAEVSYHLLDVVDPDQSYSVADFRRDAEAAIHQIRDNGRLPILVGGTGLYIDAILYNYGLESQAANTKLRDELNRLSLTELQQLTDAQQIRLNHSDYRNRRRLIRAIERGEDGQERTRQPLPKGTIIIGINLDPDHLAERIEQRLDEMLAAGLLDEARRLAARYGWENEALTGIGYRELQPVVAGESDITAARQQILTHTRQLAKRQLTWFKRNPDITWFDSMTAAQDYLNGL